MIIEDRLKNIEKEMDRLKRRNSWLTGVCLLIAGGLIGPILCDTTASWTRAQATGKAQEIRASKINILDENGAVRATLGTLPNVGPVLTLNYEHGHASAMLLSDSLGPHLVFYSSTEKVRASLNADLLGPKLILWDNNSIGRIELGVNNIGPYQTMRDERGNEIKKAFD